MSEQNGPLVLLERLADMGFHVYLDPPRDVQASKTEATLQVFRQEGEYVYLAWPGLATGTRRAAAKLIAGWLRAHEQTRAPKEASHE